MDAMQQVSFFAYGMCKNSLGPWALEFGPKTPVIINCAFGYFSPNIAIKGMVPPSLIEQSCSLKYSREALLIAVDNHSDVLGALHPAAASSHSITTVAS